MIRVWAYGNPLRQDDGLGPWVAERLETKTFPGVEVRIGHQLLPEWLEDLRSGDQLLFVDAALRGPDVTLKELDLKERPALGTGHRVTPAQFCRMARDLYGLKIQARLCSIRGERFELGKPMTDQARARGEQAVARITRFLRQALGNPRAASQVR